MPILGPADITAGNSSDAEQIDANGVPQSGIFNNLGNLFSSISADVAGTFRAVNNRNAPFSIQGSGANSRLVTSSSPFGSLENLLIPGLIIVAIFLLIEKL